MKRKLIWIIAAVLVSVFVLSIAIYCTARFVFLSPSCYSDNDELSETENYFIKKMCLKRLKTGFLLKMEIVFLFGLIQILWIRLKKRMMNTSYTYKRILWNLFLKIANMKSI